MAHRSFNYPIVNVQSSTIELSNRSVGESEFLLSSSVITEEMFIATDMTPVRKSDMRKKSVKLICRNFIGFMAN